MKKIDQKKNVRIWTAPIFGICTQASTSVHLQNQSWPEGAQVLHFPEQLAFILLVLKDGELMVNVFGYFVFHSKQLHNVLQLSN